MINTLGQKIVLKKKEMHLYYLLASHWMSLLSLKIQNCGGNLAVWFKIYVYLLLINIL